MARRVFVRVPPRHFTSANKTEPLLDAATDPGFIERALPWSCLLPYCARFVSIAQRHSALGTANKSIYKPIMSEGTKRSIFRWIHILFAIPIIGYVYSPFKELPNYAPVVRFVSIPVLVLTGLWMWKGHFLRRLILKRSA
jgi:hypothetical protein